MSLNAGFAPSAHYAAFDPEASRPLPDHPDILAELAARVAELEAERAQTLRLAQTDSLTGLVNRGAFTAALAERLEAARASGEAVALFVIDLDRFKHLNDTLGHHAGDLLLAEVGARLRRAAGPDGLVARLGGDEFALIAPAADVPRRAHELVNALSQPHAIYGRVVAPGASVGVAVFPTDAADAADLQRFADQALYRVKTRGGRRWSAFDAELRAENERRRTLEAELRRAIPAGEIEPWFQPVVDAAGGRIVGVEVLARWRHPEQGLLAPGAFVPIAEELGLIGRIDEAVFEAACRHAAPWVADGLIEHVSCNVSPRDLLDPAFSRKLIRRLGETDLPATALSVEITETFLLQDLALSRRHIERLAAKGVNIALDDFGTGYSNLRALMHLPIQTVKLDRSLINDVASDARVSRLVGSMLHAARALGVSIVAEGVEDPAQAIFLRAAGCDRMQGYLFARPMPADEMDAQLRAENVGGAELRPPALARRARG
ncbi:bifunctional diguanylate cyclase/phosphodiesterase [Phenylobacterium sp.]|uniref:putative bifunctional diguanylate cyclase/phosphodiesterase n=1 Tax=Phenylobacterium sp. TaxID=1871053 RepID=UPI002C126238|nr:bifunctional diguanylate cyclase/phosphodiesterase [Phenylobacterium sp.]HVI31129.1 bifunctional diguanylate cyclase/phosphodiesterase [Phenylobacterium sp.]